MSNIWNIIKSSIGDVLMFIFCCLLIWYGFFNVDKKGPQALKEYKDGIQNHLAWDIKGQCYFVRPNDDITVYMIRVTDCDKK